MQDGSSNHKNYESKIFDDLSLYKVIPTQKGKPVILHKDGSVSVVTRFSGINSTSFSEKDFEAKFKRIQSTLDDIKDPRISVQFVMVRDSSFPSLEENIKKLPVILRPRAEYTKTLADEYKLFTNKFYISVHCAPAKKKKKEFFFKHFEKLFAKDGWNYREYNKAFDADLNLRLMKVLDTSELLTQMLMDTDAVLIPLKTVDEYYNLFQEFTRPNKSKMKGYRESRDSKLPGVTKKEEVSGYVKINDKEESPRRDIFSAVRANVGRKDFEMDDYYHKIWSLDRAPKDWIYGNSIDVIESIPFEFIYSVTFRLLSHVEGVEMFKGKLRDARIIESSNQNAIVEDLTKTAETARIYENFQKFAYGDAYGTLASVNLVVRLKNSILEEQARAQDLTRAEMIQRIDQKVQKQVFNKFGVSEWVNEESTSFPVFCQVIPGFGNLNSDITKTIFLSTANIPYFLAMYENKRAIQHNGTNHFIDHRGNAVFFDIMDPELPAWNYSISGQTGSGKSVLMNTFLVQQFADMAISNASPVICILDVGGDRGSYQKIIKIMGGTEINLSSVVKPSIQMLGLVPERSRPTPEKIKEIANYLITDRKLNDQDDSIRKDLITRARTYYDELLNLGVNNMKEDDFKSKFLECFGFEEKPEDRAVLKLAPGTCEPDSKTINLIMAVLEVMLSDNVKQINGFIRFDYDEVAQVVYETYRRTPGRFPYLTDFLRIFDEIARPDDEDSKKLVNKFKTKMKNWTIEGMNPFFDKDTSINLNSDVILADLKGLENTPQLQVIYTLLISQLFNDKMYFLKDRRKIMVRDEAWSVMKNEKARQYFVEDLRTARKNGFATVSISQLPTDYMSPSPEDGKAIINQMQVQIFCKFGNEAAVQETAAALGLSEEVTEQMRHLGVQTKQQPDGSFKKTYSKFMMIMGGKEIYVLYNILHPFEYILYSSSADDNAVIDYYLKKKKSYKDLIDVLWMMSRNEHVGDLELAEDLERTGNKYMALRVRGVKQD
jgi:type IV secretory pathway VirB4 component